MHLAEALAIADAAELDPTRPLQLGPFELGAEATSEAIHILTGGEFPREVTWVERAIIAPLYWSVAHRAGSAAEIFGFPAGMVAGLPTAVETALVRAIAASEPVDHAVLLSGGVEIALGSTGACGAFRKVIPGGPPLVGQSLLYGREAQAIVGDETDALLSSVVLSCIANSFRTTPIKFRFLELYRVMEARFLADVKARLFLNFDAEPGAALSDAVDALKSEMNQIVGLAEAQQDAFEACWTSLDALKNTNRFATALFRRLEKKGAIGGGRWKTGAALIYQARCAIVHAGEKDIIYENFPDGDAAIEAVLPHVERAALLLVGVEVV